MTSADDLAAAMAEGRAYLARLAEIRQRPQKSPWSRVLTSVGYLMYKPRRSPTGHGTAGDSE